MSAVTQRLKALASGLRLRRMIEYSPASLIQFVFCFLPWGSIISTPDFSSSSKVRRASFKLLTARTRRISLATNHGSPSIVMVRTSPNSSLLNTVSSFISFSPLFIIKMSRIICNIRDKGESHLRTPLYRCIAIAHF